MNRVAGEETKRPSSQIGGWRCGEGEGEDCRWRCCSQGSIRNQHTAVPLTPDCATPWPLHRPSLSQWSMQQGGKAASKRRAKHRTNQGTVRVHTEPVTQQHEAGAVRRNGACLAQRVRGVSAAVPRDPRCLWLLGISLPATASGGISNGVNASPRAR